MKNGTTELANKKTKEINYFYEHCKVVELLINSLGPKFNPATKHHIRGAIREASYAVHSNINNQFIKGKNKGKALWKSKNLKHGEKSIVEHVVPVSIIIEKVMECYAKHKKISVAEIENVIKEWSFLALISMDDDKKLRYSRLTKTMPEDWDGKNKFARYEEAGIELEEFTK